MSFRPRPAGTWSTTLGVPALLSLAVGISLTVLSHQPGAGVIHAALQPTHVSVWLRQ